MVAGSHLATLWPAAAEDAYAVFTSDAHSYADLAIFQCASRAP
jgi:hypothetical protein